MPNRTSIRRLPRLAAAVLAVALVAGACSAGDPTVATVDGVEIKLSDVEAMSPRDGAIDKADFAQDLRNLIIFTVERKRAAEELGITATDEEIDAVLADLRAQVEESGQDWEEFLASQGETEFSARLIAEAQVLQEKIIEALAPENQPDEDQIVQRYNARLQGESTVCVRHILVETLEEAEEVKARLEAGEDFATVAREVSIDPSAQDNGGDLGCSAPNQYVPEFAAATMAADVGEVAGPVKTQFGYHIIVVDDRQSPTLEEMRADVEAELARFNAGQALGDWLIAALQEADIEIDPQYGTWQVIDPNTGQPNPQVIPAP